MALPKIQAPIFTYKLPVLNKKIKYRPFTVKEEKILLMASESGDPTDVYTAFQQVVNNCVLDEDVDALKLHIFDMEVLFLLLRIASVGAETTFGIIDKESGKAAQVELNLQDVVDDSVKNAVIPSKQIQITEEVGLVMKDITLDLFMGLGAGATDDISAQDAFAIIKRLIEKVYDKDNVYELEDFSDEEVNDFLDSFQSTDMEKVYEYLHAIPRVRQSVKYKVGKEEREVTLEGVADFFQSA